MFDDGPFHGAPTTAIHDHTPDQSFPIWSGLTLEVFDSMTEGVSPTVQLRLPDESVQWAVVADGHQSGDVRSIRFTNTRRGFGRSSTVNAVVDWTYGHEAAYWIITRNGRLREYWYSW